MKEMVVRRCSAVDGRDQCRCMKNLTRCLISRQPDPKSPTSKIRAIVIELCPKHFAERLGWRAA
jgi:hypothetical protein